MTSASSDVGPAEGGVFEVLCVSILHLAPSLGWEVQSLGSLWAQSCWGVGCGCGKESRQNSWPVTAGRALSALLVGRTGKVKLCLFHAPWRGGAALIFWNVAA